MEYKGPVSLWLGRADSKRALDAFLKTSYTEDGDLVASAFMRAFGIDDYDEDFQEAFITRTSRSLATILKGCSYDDQVIPQFAASLGASLSRPANAVLLLYGFHFKGRIVRGAGPGVALTFHGLARFVHRSCP